MLSLKVVLFSTAVILTALGLKASLIPLVTTHLHLIWNFFLLCFTPPYLFVTVNAIIISILASSRFHQSQSQSQSQLTPPPLLLVNNLLLTDSPTPILQQTPQIHKPLLSTRFTHRKPLKSNPEGGKALRVAKQKRHETLENTWKTITEGRSIPLSRHIKKCDTWHNRYDASPHETEDSSVSISDFNLNKTWKLRKEPSLSQDELNKRVEAFIRKFNHQMRLQRQESLNHHYMHAHD